MERMRKPFQGVLNIILFNWHFYIVSIGLVVLLSLFTLYFAPTYSFYLYVVCFLAFVPILISLLVSFYVYDLSDLYKLNWFDELDLEETTKIININAGFDETSELLEKKFENAELIVLDFYDASKHTEISIKRARKEYPPFKNTKPINTTKIPLEDNSADKIFLILSAHEIRNNRERTAFFKELRRILQPNGQIILTEHLRNMPNFLAYNIGAFHFHSEKTWLENTREANLKLTQKIKITPFIKTFVFEKNGNTS
jgi:ubiquinone/menaquinone biosynthesis C-methylase UbiE